MWSGLVCLGDWGGGKGGERRWEKRRACEWMDRVVVRGAGVYWECHEWFYIFHLHPSEQTVAILLVCPVPLLQPSFTTRVVFFPISALTFLELKGRQR